MVSWRRMGAIYQQARPFRFDQLVGQEHVRDVLLASLERNRTGHAYLFSGPRGVGKTTTARLLAMALNCEGGVGGERPCGTCDSCRLVRNGNHPDVIELDAASNNSVEDVRDLREKVGLASLRGGIRVWILDEAHMLSRAAANALLKTLEEPPARLAFILATTEPEKLPATILSRCQHFRFRRLGEPEISGKLAAICDQAGVEADREALGLIARAAEGAMRDAESLLERLLASGRRITLQDAEETLGLPPKERLEGLAIALADGAPEAMLRIAGELYRDGFAPRTLAEQLAVVLRDALFGKVAGGDGSPLPLDEEGLMLALHALDEEMERFVRRDDLFSLEVALIKTHNTVVQRWPVRAVPAEAAEPVRRDRPGTGRALPDFDPGLRRRQPSRPEGAAAEPGADARSAGENGTGTAPLDWHLVKSQASAQLKAFLMPARNEIGQGTLTLRYGDNYKFHFNEVKKRLDELSTLVHQVAGEGYLIQIEGPGDPARKKS